ncbi:HipA domain-containing protein [Luteimonas sp. gir]|uniref:type II toxin-antitoxin system HipA family toxin n=1 Tax=Luteimonas sp. gir TaxID=3127960 RepID=UPI003075E5DE
MDSAIELYINGTWHCAARIAVNERAVRFEYLPDYVFGHLEHAPPVALSLPVNMEIHTWSGASQTPLAFLWDLVPQGRGREHLAGLLGVSAQDATQDFFLAQHGAFAPIGRLRLDTAVEFYQRQTGGAPAEGFKTRDISERTDAFLAQLALHNMLAAGTPGVQGVAPKFLLTQDEEGRWYPDAALPDARAREHWIIKLPRGRDPSDQRILRHESIYLQAVGACGLRTIDTPVFKDGMLFLRRFDRQVGPDGVVHRLHQETLSALAGLPGFGRNASLFALTERLADMASNPAQAVAEFLCRDVLNRALRNPDNHVRNTSVQQCPDGTVQLTPLYDIGPMYLDRELITRTCDWRLPEGGITDDWNVILERLALHDDVKVKVAIALKTFGEQHLPKLTQELRMRDADADIVEACETAIGFQITKLQAIAHHATPTP